MSYLKSDINDIIKNEKLECRNNPLPTNCAPTNTNNLQQGQEAINANPVTRCTKKPPIDMNDYIRKDSIPCWGCSVP
jgi:hypothetical protein